MHDDSMICFSEILSISWPKNLLTSWVYLDMQKPHVSFTRFDEFARTLSVDENKAGVVVRNILNVTDCEKKFSEMYTTAVNM